MPSSIEAIVNSTFQKEEQSILEKISDYLTLLFKWHDTHNIISSSDIELLKNVGLSVTVPNANYKDIVKHSDWITPRQGGFGAVRDICDLIILAKNDEESYK